ncbi:hypothetical protein HMPREF9946_04151 [Acetobacteraceae bacterium AT-5844]|nr:hypothetical protein HMPREF9946_04151 [Acetobacteraceae bacterium AT-5844]
MRQTKELAADTPRRLIPCRPRQGRLDGRHSPAASLVLARPCVPPPENGTELGAIQK